MILLLITCVIVEAKETEPTFTSICHKVKEPNGVWTNKGQIYIIKKGIMQFGLVKCGGNTYYCHYTNSKKYPRGSAVRGEMKIIGGKWYAFDPYGQLIKSDYYIQKGRFKWRKSLEVCRDYSVKYVYSTAAIHRGRRYSTAERRCQELQPNNTWKSVGKRFYPSYVDRQK